MRHHVGARRPHAIRDSQRHERHEHNEDKPYKPRSHQNANRRHESGLTGGCPRRGAMLERDLLAQCGATVPRLTPRPARPPSPPPPPPAPRQPPPSSSPTPTAPPPAPQTLPPKTEWLKT